MALIDEAKTWLRLSTCDADLTAQVQMLVDSAISDLTNTADVSPDCFTDQTNVDALPKTAIMVYVQAMWSDDEDAQEKLLNRYDGIKAKLATASRFNRRGGFNGLTKEG